MSVISEMILFSKVALLDRFAIALSAPRLSDLISKLVDLEMREVQFLSATKIASASHRVVNADSPRFA